MNITEFGFDFDMMFNRSVVMLVGLFYERRSEQKIVLDFSEPDLVGERIRVEHVGDCRDINVEAVAFFRQAVGDQQSRKEGTPGGVGDDDADWCGG